MCMFAHRTGLSRRGVFRAYVVRVFRHPVGGARVYTTVVGVQVVEKKIFTHVCYQHVRVWRFIYTYSHLPSAVESDVVIHSHPSIDRNKKYVYPGLNSNSSNATSKKYFNIFQKLSRQL